MKIIHKFIVFIIVSLVVGLGSAFNGQMVNNNESLESKKTTYIIENEILKEETDDTVEIQDTTSENKIKQESNNSFSASNETTTSTNNSNEKFKTKPKNEIPKTEKKDTKQKSKITSNSTEKEQTAWEKLGVTEYEYYNTPDTKWKKVTHSNIEECRKAGNQAIGIKYDVDGLAYQDYEQYWCYDVISYSGKYLGAMLSLK